MPTNIFTKFDKDQMKTRCLNPSFGQFKGHNSGVHEDLAHYRTWSRYDAYQIVHQV